MAAGTAAAFLSTSSGLVVSLAGVLFTDVLRGRWKDFRLAAVASAVLPIAMALTVERLDFALTVPLVFEQDQPEPGAPAATGLYASSINSERNNLESPAEDQGNGFEQALGIGGLQAQDCSTGTPRRSASRALLRTRTAPPGSPMPPFRAPTAPSATSASTSTAGLRRAVGRPGTEHERDGTFPQNPNVALVRHDLHGPFGFSEPEVDAVRQFTRDRNLTMLIGNHTFTGLMLRPPGTATYGLAEDELALKELGDRMAIETDYVSQFGFQLYDTTGSLDDYIYGGLGAFAYTPEIGKQSFHPNYLTGFVPEYEGREIEDPDTGEGTGPLPRRPARGLPEGRRSGAAWTTHSILRGTAPAAGPSSSRAT